jgi:thioredoxin-related protein
MKALLALALACAASLAGALEPWERFFDPFLGDLRAELAAARASGRKGLVVMYQFEDCPGCKRMKRDVLGREDVRAWYRGQFVVVSIDTLGAQPVTGVDGETRPEKEHARAAGILATPSFDFLDLDGRLVYRQVGGIYDAAQFVQLGQYVASGAHRAQSFEAFRRARRDL